MLAVLVVFLIIAYAKLFSKQTDYHKKIAATTNSVLILENFDKARVKVVTGKNKEIKIDLKGSSDDILSILKAEAGIYTTLEFADEASDVSGTITVPEGMLLDITLSEGRLVTIDDIGGKKVVSGEDSFLVDTNNLGSLTVDDSGNVSLNSSGDLTVWDDEEWDPLDGNTNENPLGIVYCGIGAQSIRDYCCEVEHEGESTPVCGGLGHWFFNNSARDCDYACDEEEEEVIDESDCGIGSQGERNSCCEEIHQGEYMGCIGYWRFDNSNRICAYECTDPGDPSNPGDLPGEEGGEGGDSEPFTYGDAVSDFCVDMVTEEDRNQCCDDSLGNALSSGPRPGFPDCIGYWMFDVLIGCRFECAEHSEMIEILNEIRSQAQ